MADASPLYLKVFVSSPGDVGRERAKALALLRGLASEPWAQGKVVLQPVMWDDPQARAPMDAAKTPQASVNDFKGLPADCDLTIIVLWSRIGSPPAMFRPDGSRYASGTVWEYENARAGPGTVWIYRGTTKPTIEIDDPLAEQKREQYLAVKSFFDAFQDKDGVLTGGYWPYADAEEFGTLLHQHLQAFVRDRLERQAVPAEPARAAAREAPSQPYLVPEVTRDHRFVGRQLLLERVWQEVVAGRHCSLVFLAGVGKTTAALELVRQRERVLAHFDGVLWADLGRRPDTLLQLRRWAEALNVPPPRMAAATTLDDWKTLLRTAIGSRHFLLVLDDVWDARHAHEFTALAPRCVAIVTTRLRPVAARLARQDHVTEVVELSEAEGMELLHDIAPNAVAADGAAALELVRAVQGLPLALVLVGKFLKRESGNNDPDRVREAFDTLQRAGMRLSLPMDEGGDGDDGRTLEEIIDVSYAALRSDEARSALACLSIFRPKPHALSKAMALEICGAPSERLYELNDMGLIEHSGQGDYTMHRVICEYARKKLPRAMSLALHRKALDWYGKLLRDDLEGEPEAYLGWYRYEQADWQATKDAWLHHLAASGDAAGSTLAFLRVYFEAFWWWGYYQHFPFCERLLREWSAREIGKQQRRGLEQLQMLQDNYPSGHGKRAGSEQWGRVKDALLGLREDLRLERPFKRIENADAQRVRSYTDFFLAECAAYGDADHAAAMRLYETAQQQFAGMGARWEAAWIGFYIGQYLIERGDTAAARERVTQALADAGEELPLRKRDPELLANDYRLLGELDLAAGDLDAGARNFRRAAFYAIAFQAVPKMADSYTVAFHREISGRISAAVAELHAAQPARGKALARSLAQFWEPWWMRCYPRSGRMSLAEALKAPRAVLEAWLFPAVPAEDAVVEEAPEFAVRVLAVLDALRERGDIVPDPIPAAALAAVAAAGRQTAAQT